MHNFLFECSSLGLMVQGTLKTPPPPEQGVRILYECPACGRAHLVDPWASPPGDDAKTGET